MKPEHDPTISLGHDLERALRRESPAPGFAQRVLERIAREETRPSPLPQRRPVWWRAAAASVTLTLLLGGYATHKVIQHRRGEQAKAQVLEAMRIAGQKVRLAQSEVRGIGARQ